LATARRLLRSGARREQQQPGRQRTLAAGAAGSPRPPATVSCGQGLSNNAMTDAADELLCGIGGESTVLGAQELREAVKVTLDKLGPKEKVLIIPPVRDGCRSNAHAAAFLPW
jgi:hypothetical protein